jgi:PhzF family phenazine biosynthesis protein
MIKWRDYVGVSVICPHPDRGPADYEMRNLSPSSGMSEDPITGSLNAAIARWMREEGRLTRDMVIAQGARLGCKGRVSIRIPPAGSDRVLIGGHSQIVIDGRVEI